MALAGEELVIVERASSSSEPLEPPLRAGMLAAHPWAAVALLMVVTIFNNVDRFLPAILAEPMKRELKLSDTFLGVLNGLGFLVIYALACIPIARRADSGRFGAVISASLAGWSLMTLLGGMVVSAWQLAATRAGVALGEAGSTPPPTPTSPGTSRPKSAPAPWRCWASERPSGSWRASSPAASSANCLAGDRRSC